MKIKILLTISTVLLIATACGKSDKPAEASTFYKKDSVSEKKLEVSIEASGIIEAISSVEIKSKASGEILYLGAEVGDTVEKLSLIHI